MNKILVLISGRMGSGKSTLRTALMEALDEGHVTNSAYSFARPIYEGHDLIQAFFQSKYGIPALKKDRILLQLLGSEWGRNTRGENVWVDCARHFIANEDAQVIIIDDCRFPNELLADYGVPTVTVRLQVAEDIRRQRLGDRFTGDSHPSETALDEHILKFDQVIVNNGELTPGEIVERILPTIVGKLGVTEAA